MEIEDNILYYYHKLCKDKRYIQLRYTKELFEGLRPVCTYTKKCVYFVSILI